MGTYTQNQKVPVLYFGHCCLSVVSIVDNICGWKSVYIFECTYIRRKMRGLVWLGPVSQSVQSLHSFPEVEAGRVYWIWQEHKKKHWNQNVAQTVFDTVFWYTASWVVSNIVAWSSGNSTFYGSNFVAAIWLER